jgi:hypothetical protein
LFGDNGCSENGEVHALAFAPFNFSDDPPQMRDPFFVLAGPILRTELAGFDLADLGAQRLDDLYPIANFEFDGIPHTPKPSFISPTLRHSAQPIAPFRLVLPLLTGPKYSEFAKESMPFFDEKLGGTITFVWRGKSSFILGV